MAAGIELAKGTNIVTMDGDLQNDPTDIPRLLEVIAEGADLAVGWRFQRKDKLVTRKIPSRIANWLIGRVTGIPIRDNGCSLKAYRASVIKRVPLYSEMHRFIPAMTSIAGARVVEVKVSHHARQFGQSKYGLSRIYRVALDLLAIKTLTSFASRPIQWFAALAMPAMLASALVTVVILAGMARTDDGSLVIAAGVAMLLAATGGFYLVCGVLGALVFETGHVRPGELLGLTAKKVSAHE
jgi:hypothetical protein